MTRIVFSDDTSIDAIDAYVLEGVLHMVTPVNDLSVLLPIARNPEAIAHISFRNENDEELHHFEGYIKFSGMDYQADDTVDIKLVQPIDDTERRISEAEGAAARAMSLLNSMNAKIDDSNDMIIECIMELASIVYA